MQQAGKCVEVQAGDLDDARAVMAQLRPEGIWMCVGGQYSIEQAESFLAEATRWAEGKK